MALRRDCVTFLEQVHQREQVLANIKGAVSRIKNDSFFYPEQDEHETKPTNDEQLEKEYPRCYMKKVGNQLVDHTDGLLKKTGPFLARVCKMFANVKIETFVF